MKKEIAAEIARIIAADADPKIEFNLPPNAEVHFVGRPILALDPKLNNMTVPTRFLRHPLVQDRYFCTLPASFLNDVVERVGRECFDSAQVELETHLSTMCGDHSLNAGFRSGRPFAFCLRRQPVVLPEEQSQSAGLDRNQAALDHAARIAEERIAGMFRTTRAYAGWLMTNPQFLGELGELLRTWDAMVRRWGFDRLGIVLPSGMFHPSDDPMADERWAGYSAAFESFFARWRLRGMAAPYLPLPLEPLMSGRFPVTVLQQLMNSGGVFVLPDIYPVPSRDQLRGLLEDALHTGNAADHLADWMALVAGENAVKTPFIKFARLFEVQHYYRLLHHRHASALHRKLAAVKEALAAFLGVERRTINEDLAFIKERLGPAWVERGRDR